MANPWEGRARGPRDFTAEEDQILHDAFAIVQEVLAVLGPDGTKNLLHLMQAADAYHAHVEGEYYSYTLSRALALDEFRRGVEEKERIGLENDTYRTPDGLRPLLSGAYMAGQEAAKLSWFMERPFVARLFSRPGPLRQPHVTRALFAAKMAYEAFRDREEE